MIVRPQDFAGLLRALLKGSVEFIVVGGVAAAVHGAARSTYDIDIVYARSRENIDRLVAALSPLRPYLRGAPPGLPFVFDRDTVERGLNFTLETSLGDLDVLGEIVGGGTYESLLSKSATIEVFGMACRVVALDALIRLKRAAGRPKDFEAIAELEALIEERDTRRNVE